MHRIEFIKRCGSGCLGLSLMSGTLLQGCSGAKYVQAPIQDSHLIVPTSAFEVVKNNLISFRRYVVAQNTALQFPICIYRNSDEQFLALWMRCTHQGNELQAFGDKLQCPAHGSEFTSTGAVQNGPADEPLRSFDVVVAEGQLKISLR